MKWVYKIWSGYDRFRPSQIPFRMDGDELKLGWRQYIDEAVAGDDVWVWFFGPGTYTPGVYVKGIIESVDRTPGESKVFLRVQDWSATASLTSDAENLALAPVVKQRKRQVFVLPDAFASVGPCTARSVGAPSCSSRHCDRCPYWDGMPLIRRSHLLPPDLIVDRVAAFVPAYWVIARRSFVFMAGDRARVGVRRSSEMFNRFKAGESALAYPLARGISKALAERGLLDFDLIVPVPLSPDKMALEEIHRTLLLANALGALTKKPVVEAIMLTAPKGKRKAIAAGCTPAEFRSDYTKLLAVDIHSLVGVKRILLLDDVCTSGNTFSATLDALEAAGVTSEVIAASAGQMTIRDAVRVESAVLKPLPNP